MVRNILGVIVGIVVGMVVNITILTVGHAIIPPPAGFDQTSMDTMAATIHVLEPRNYISVFLAHALGPLVGTLVAVLIAVTNKMKIAIGLAVAFLVFGIIANFMIPAPTWFGVVDLVFAYVPMALIGAKLGGAGK